MDFVTVNFRKEKTSITSAVARIAQINIICDESQKSDTRRKQRDRKLVESKSGHVSSVTFSQGEYTLASRPT